MIIGALVMAVSMMILGYDVSIRTPSVSARCLHVVYTAGFAMSWGSGRVGYCWQRFSRIDPFDCMSIAVAGQWIANFLSPGLSRMLDRTSI